MCVPGLPKTPQERDWKALLAFKEAAGGGWHTHSACSCSVRVLLILCPPNTHQQSPPFSLFLCLWFCLCSFVHSTNHTQQKGQIKQKYQKKKEGKETVSGLRWIAAQSCLLLFCVRNIHCPHFGAKPKKANVLSKSGRL